MDRFYEINPKNPPRFLVAISPCLVLPKIDFKLFSKSVFFYLLTKLRAKDYGAIINLKRNSKKTKSSPNELSRKASELNIGKGSKTLVVYTLKDSIVSYSKQVEAFSKFFPNKNSQITSVEFNTDHNVIELKRDEITTHIQNFIS